VEGPDVTIKDAAFKGKQAEAAKMPGGRAMLDKRGRRWVLGNQGRVHMIMAGHALVKIEKVYGTIFENILGEKISTKPVEIVTPFPWVKAKGLEKKGG
jgi:hypothetical protein